MTVGVVGAGAAGLWVAWRARQVLGGREEVVLLEKTPRTGTKILASGGTRCNLTTTLGPESAAELFGRRGGRFLRPAFSMLPPFEVRARFEALGVPTVEAPLEKVFPVSGRARDVRDALERAAREAGARIELRAGVTRVLPVAGGREGYEVVRQDGVVARFERLVLAPGGRSYPRTGTTGDGYAWLADLGLPAVEPVPALVPLSSPARWVRELAGIAWADGEVRLVDPRGRVLGRRRRPLLFTHRGVSGPAAMDLSEGVSRAERTGTGGLALELDLFPDRSREELRDRLVRAAAEGGPVRLSRLLPRPVPRRLRTAIASAAGLGNEDRRVSGLTRAERHAWIEHLKRLVIPVEGTLGYEHAEVTAGGLALDAVDPRSMRVNAYPGLFAVGEILDLAGPIGGLNFQAAFACAEVCAQGLRRG